MKWTKEQVNLMIHNRDKTINDLCVLTKHNYNAVRHKMKRLNLKYTARQKRKSKYVKDSCCFSDPCLINSYWAGFIAADGCINKDNSLCIALSSVDREQLEKFRNFIKFNGPIYDYINQKGYPGSKISIYSAHNIIKDLEEKYSIVQRKTLILNPPKINDITQVISYMIGYLDGDGCISYRKRDKTFSIQFAGTNSMMTWFKKYCDVLILPRKNKRCCNVYKHGNIFGYSIQGKRAIRLIKALDNFILSANIPRMKRKWDKIYEYTN